MAEHEVNPHCKDVHDEFRRFKDYMNMEKLPCVEKKCIEAVQRVHTRVDGIEKAKVPWKQFMWVVGIVSAVLIASFSYTTLRAGENAVKKADVDRLIRLEYEVEADQKETKMIRERQIEVVNTLKTLTDNQIAMQRDIKEILKYVK